MRRCAPGGFADTDAVNSPHPHHGPADALADAERAGIDLSLIDSNLALSYEERLLRHDAALELVQAIRAATGKLHPDASTPPASTQTR
jgi:hypothetical protein